MMMHVYLTQRLMGLLLVVVLALVGCSRQDPLYVAEGEDTNELPTVYLEISPNPTTTHVATTRAFTAYRVDTAAGSREDVTASASWNSSATTIASVNSAGVATGVAAGTSDITAQLDGLSASSALTVSDAALVELVVVPPEQASLVGISRTFKALARFADNQLQDVSTDVSWNSNNTAVSIVADDGSASSLSQGTATLTASLLGQNASGDLVVLNATPVDFQVSPQQATLPVPSHEAFSATLLLSDGEILDVTSEALWSTSAADVVSVSNQTGSKGDALAVAAGTAQVVASLSVAGVTVVDTADITVTAPTLVQVVVTPATATVPVGTRGVLVATAFYSDNSSRVVTQDSIWQSSETAVATVVPTGSQAGQGVALAEGTTQISAILSGKTGQATVTVTPAALVSLQIAPAISSVSSGLTVQYYASGLYSDGVIRNVTDVVSWQSGDSNVAVIDAGGLAQSRNLGNTQISALLAGLQADAQLQVTAATLLEIEVAPLVTEVALGNRVAYRATGIYSDGNTLDLTNVAYWQSNNTSVASPFRTGVVATRAMGNAIISAQYDNLTGSAALRVTQAVLQQLLVIPDSLTLQKGAVQQYSAVGFFSDHIEDVTEQSSWISSNNALATVSNDFGGKGVVSTLAPGTLNITAYYGGFSDGAALTILAPTLVSMAVYCDDVSVVVGYSTQCEAVATYSDGSSRYVTDEAAWQSSTPGVASVQNAVPRETGGTVTGVSVGTSSISATLNGVSDSELITVTAVVLQSIAVTSQEIQLVEGDREPFYATGTFNDASTSDLTRTAFWQVADTGVLSVSNSASEKGWVTALAVGNTTVSASQDGVTGTSVTITVIASPIANVRKVNILCLDGEFAGPVQIGVNEIDRCKAYAIHTDDSVEDVTASASWSVDKPSILSIVGLTSDNAYMQVKGESHGNTILRAEFGKKAVIQYKVK